MSRMFGWIVLGALFVLGTGCKKDPYNKPPDTSSAPTVPRGATGVLPSASNNAPESRQKASDQPKITVAKSADSDDDDATNSLDLQKPLKVKKLPTILFQGKKKKAKKKKKKAKEALSFGVGGLQMDPSIKGMFGKPSGSLFGTGSLALSGGDSLKVEDADDDEDPEDGDDGDDVEPSSKPAPSSRPTSAPAKRTVAAAQPSKPSSRPTARRQPVPERIPPNPIKENPAAPIQTKTGMGTPNLRGPFAEPAKAPSIPKILAKVNDSPVDRWSFVQSFKEVQRLWTMKAGFPPSGPMLGALRVQAVKQLIDQLLVYQKAQQEGLALSGTEVRQGLQMFFSRFPKRTTLEDYVRDQGMNRAKFMEIMKRKLLVRKYMMSLAKQVPVKREEIISYYKKNLSSDTVKARQIVISIEKGKEEASKTKALSVLKLAREQGANFVALVKQYSDDPSKELGGDIGTLKRGDLLPALENVLFSLKKGQVGGPVQTAVGYHILQVVQRKRPTPLRRIQMKIVEKLQMKRLEVILKKQVKELREDGNIEIFVPWAKD